MQLNVSPAPPSNLRLLMIDKIALGFLLVVGLLSSGSAEERQLFGEWRHPEEGGPEVMQLSRYWHPKMNWYGPSGIGTGRGIAGFRNWHQIPFLSAMPDRGQFPEETSHHFFGDGPYVAVTGWPNSAICIAP